MGPGQIIVVGRERQLTPIRQFAGDSLLAAGSAGLSTSTANGDDVPLFGTTGNILVFAIDPITGENYGLVVSGTFNLAKKGGGGSTGL
jgi:hypothetical protein